MPGAMSPPRAVVGNTIAHVGGVPVLGVAWAMKHRPLAQRSLRSRSRWPTRQCAAVHQQRGDSGDERARLHGSERWLLRPDARRWDQLQRVDHLLAHGIRNEALGCRSNVECVDQLLAFDLFELLRPERNVALLVHIRLYLSVLRTRGSVSNA
jgi:hypothetical protein